MSNFLAKRPFPNQELNISNGIVDIPKSPWSNKPHYTQCTSFNLMYTKEKVSIYKIWQTLFLHRIPFTSPKSYLTPYLLNHQTIKKEMLPSLQTNTTQNAI